MVREYRPRLFACDATHEIFRPFVGAAHLGHLSLPNDERDPRIAQQFRAARRRRGENQSRTFSSGGLTLLRLAVRSSSLHPPGTPHPTFQCRLAHLRCHTARLSTAGPPNYMCGPPMHNGSQSDLSDAAIFPCPARATVASS